MSQATQKSPQQLAVTVVQWRPGEDPSDNLDQMAAHISAASQRGSSLVVFPEYSQRHISPPDPRWTATHEPVTGPWVAGLAKHAGHYGVTVIAGMMESSSTNKPFNTQIVVDGTGLVALSRKIHLYDAFSMTESDLFSPGPATSPEVAVVSGMTIGVQTCYDLRFPEVTRQLVDAGSEVVVVPAQWVPGPHKEDQWLTLLSARAIEAQVWVVAADHPAPTGVGRSAIVSPRGEVVAVAGLGEETLDHTLDLHSVATVRTENPMAGSRRLKVTWG